MSERPLTPQEVQLFLTMRPQSRRAFMAAMGATAAAVSLSACSPAADKEKAAGSAEITKIEIPGSEGTKLEFYNWDTYTPETTLADFKAA
ncbi:MAG: hypothetical protein RLZZ157_1247, partial [Pseudomonadota bacterium]